MQTDIEKKTAEQSDPYVSVGWGERFGYAAGDMASCLYFGIFMSFMNYFYTDVFGISAAALGTMILITRTWDWINDPIMGVIADRTETKMGKFRPWILWMIPLYVLLGILTFTTFDLGPTGKLVYAYVTYTLLMMVYTAINVPYGALMGVMTAKSEERTILATFRFIGSNAGTTTVAFLLPILVLKIGRGNEQVGYSGAVTVLALMAGALFFMTFRSCKERIRPIEKDRIPLKQEFAMLGKNGPWLIVIALSICTVLSQAVRAGALLHFFKYVSGDVSWGEKLIQFNAIAAIFTVMLSKWIISWIGCKKRAYIVLNLLFAALLIWFYYIPITSFKLMIANQLLMALVAAPMMPLFWSMIADTADYGAVKLGHRSTGVIFSAGTASQKIGWTVGPAFAMLILSAVGFVANEEQAPETIQMLRLLMSFIPAAFAILTAVVTAFYPINHKVELELAASLREMNKVSDSSE